MGWWHDIWMKQAEEWTYVELHDDQVPDGVKRAPIAPDASYLSVFLRSMGATPSRMGTSRFYGAVHSLITLPQLSDDGTGKASFQVFAIPGELRDIDPRHPDRFLSLNRRLLGPIPYRGGDLSVEVGLFSVKSADLVAPFLGVVEKMASLAGVSFVQVAAPFAEPLLTAVNLLADAEGDAIFQIGLGREFPAPGTGYFLVMQCPKGTFDPGDFRVDDDFRLITRAGQPIDRYPYLLICVEAARQRDDWHSIPDLQAAYNALRSDAAQGNLKSVQEDLVVFNRTARFSPDLLDDDAARLIKLITDKFGSEQPVPTPAPDVVQPDISDEADYHALNLAERVILPEFRGIRLFAGEANNG